MPDVVTVWFVVGFRSDVLVAGLLRIKYFLSGEWEALGLKPRSKKHLQILCQG